MLLTSRPFSMHTPEKNEVLPKFNKSNSRSGAMIGDAPRLNN